MEARASAPHRHFVFHQTRLPPRSDFSFCLELDPQRTFPGAARLPRIFHPFYSNCKSPRGARVITLHVLLQLTAALLSPLQLPFPFTYGKPSQTKCLTACSADDAEAANAETSGERFEWSHVLRPSVKSGRVVEGKEEEATLQGSPACLYLMADIGFASTELLSLVKRYSLDLEDRKEASQQCSLYILEIPYAGFFLFFIFNSTRVVPSFKPLYK